MAELIQDLLDSFREAAIRKAAGELPAREDHALHAQMAEAYRGLKEHGQAGELAFRALLHDESAHVRGWVAAQLLAEGDTSARFVLESLRREPGLLGLGAQIVLEEHEKGKLKPPFGVVGA